VRSLYEFHRWITIIFDKLFPTSAVLNLVSLRDHENFVSLRGPPGPAENNQFRLPTKSSGWPFKKWKNSLNVSSALHFYLHFLKQIQFIQPNFPMTFFLVNYKKIAFYWLLWKKRKIPNLARGPPGRSPRTTGWEPLSYMYITLANTWI